MVEGGNDPKVKECNRYIDVFYLLKRDDVLKKSAIGQVKGSNDMVEFTSLEDIGVEAPKMEVEEDGDLEDILNNDNSNTAGDGSDGSSIKTVTGGMALGAVMTYSIVSRFTKGKKATKERKRIKKIV